MYYMGAGLLTYVKLIFVICTVGCVLCALKLHVDI